MWKHIGNIGERLGCAVEAHSPARPCCSSRHGVVQS